MAAKKANEFGERVYRRKGDPERLKIEGDWQDAARKLLAPKPETPARQVKKRKAGKPSGK